MKKADTWMPFYVADYLGDTMHLSTLQHGAYVLLLLASWKSGGSLPDDDEQLAAITRMSLSEWRKSSVVLRRFFQCEDGLLTQGRLKEELEKARALSEKRSGVGTAGAAAKWGEGGTKTSGKTAAALRSERLAEARKKGRHTPAEWAALVEILGSRCVACGTSEDDLVGGTLCKDHIQPIFKGGDDSIQNLQPMCRQCNTSKGGDCTDHRTRWVEDWQKRLAKRLADGSQTSGPSPSHIPSSLRSEGLEPSALVPEDADAPRRPPPSPNEQIVELYHRHLPTLPRVEVLSDARKRTIGARWREVLADPEIARSPEPRVAALQFFDWYFDHAAKSRFLTGRAKDWRADFDFLMTPAKWVKVIEGHYHKEAA